MVDQEKLKQFQKDIEEIFPDTLNDEEIKDNKKLFIFDKQLYRVRMPKQKELFSADNIRKNYKVELLQKGTITRDKLIKLLKESEDIDIIDLEKQKEELENQIIKKWVELGPKYSDEKEVINKLKEELKILDLKHQELCYIIIDHLKPCVELQCDDLYYNILTSYCTEKETEDNKWISVWNNYQQFEDEDPALVKTAVRYFARLYNKLRRY